MARPDQVPRHRRRQAYCAILMLVTVVMGSQSSGAGVIPDPRRPFPPRDAAHRDFNAICYGPHRDGQRPGGPDPTEAEIREDLHLMREHWQLMRLYGAGEPSETILRLIRADSLDFEVVLGAWIAPDAPDDNRREVETAIRLANAYRDIVVAVCVGNETQVYWSAHRSPLSDLVDHIRRVRASVAVPVTTSDDFAFWIEPESRRLDDEVDFLTVNAHPLWNGQQLDDGLSWLQGRLGEIGRRHPDQLIVVGETGWATDVADHGEQSRLIKGEASEAAQEVFYDRTRRWAEASGTTVFFFEAFDEKWKGGDDPREVEKHWGLFRADRSPKPAMTDRP